MKIISFTKTEHTSKERNLSTFCEIKQIKTVLQIPIWMIGLHGELSMTGTD